MRPEPEYRFGLDHVSLVAFGVILHSDYRRVEELGEMLVFAGLLHRGDLARHVRRVDYHSKYGVCRITFADGFDLATREADQIRAAAVTAFTQFEWAGVVHDGMRCRGE